MPTIAVPRDLFYEKLGVTMSDEEFDQLCFDFGIELDEVTSELKEMAKEQGEAKAKGASEEIIYKIELPANRYDLLCLEGLVRALRAFLGKEAAPQYQVKPAKETLTVKAATGAIRPVCVAAVLRGMRFTPANYASFIDLQDKLHSGVGRQRTIVSMGTHDLDTVNGPFVYDARDPAAIRFIPLNQSQEMDGNALMKHYEGDLKIRKFLPIIRDAPRYPVILDAQERVMSLPPLINSEHSKIHLGTRNVFIEVTATDLTRAQTALAMIVTAFAGYCESIEAVNVVYEADPERRTVCPDLAHRQELVSCAYVNRLTGLALDPTEMASLLARMMLRAQPIKTETGEDWLQVTVPPTRTDVIHACDVMEDVAIAYGFNRIPKHIPACHTVGAALPLNKLTDQLRREVALAGWTEIYTFTLCSHAENFAHLRKTDPGNEAVVLANPKTIEFEVVQSSLMPQMLKTLASNKSMPLPIKIFQILDVLLLDPANEVGARNERRLSALYCNVHTGFEVIHGLVDRVMLMLNVSPGRYTIRPSQLPTYFPDRQAEVLLDGKVIGSFGIVHPEVMANFEAPYVCSLMELNIEPFL